jgi:hypothetical protein
MYRMASGYALRLFVLFLVACGGTSKGGSTQSTQGASSSGSGTGSTGSGGATGGGGAGGGSGGTVGMGGTGGSGVTGTGGASGDAGTPCSVGSTPGECLEVSACKAMSGYSSTPGYCPGPADVECCTMGPGVADNPPIPAGYHPMMQADVTQAMTDWAVMILNDPTDYPMFSTAMMTFGTQPVLARVEWHPPDFQNPVVHRGVTLYEPN